MILKIIDQFLWYIIRQIIEEYRATGVARTLSHIQVLVLARHSANVAGGELHIWIPLQANGHTIADAPWPVLKVMKSQEEGKETVAKTHKEGEETVLTVVKNQEEGKETDTVLKDTEE